MAKILKSSDVSLWSEPRFENGFQIIDLIFAPPLDSEVVARSAEKCEADLSFVEMSYLMTGLFVYGFQFRMPEDCIARLRSNHGAFVRPEFEDRTDFKHTTMPINTARLSVYVHEGAVLVIFRSKSVLPRDEIDLQDQTYDKSARSGKPLHV